MKNILYVLHSGVTGGTFLTNKDLMKNIDSEFNVFLLTAEVDSLNVFKYRNDELFLIKSYPRFHQWSAKNFHDSWLNYIYFDVITKFGIDIIHIRHLINHSFDLPQIAKKLNIPVIFSFHDFYFICPFYVLLDENYDFCNGVCSDNNLNCYNPLKYLNDIHSKRFISQWRKNVLNLLNFVDCLVTTSDFVKNLFLSIYPSINEKDFYVIEHGRDFNIPKFFKKYSVNPSKSNPIKILCPANHLNIMKGSELIKDIKKEDKDNLIEFHFLGNCHDNVDEYGVNHGTFERDDFHKKVEEIKPSFIGIFSIWPETFCHTITEAWSCEIPVLGSNIGVIEDRILKNKGGWIINRNNPKEAYNKILDIAYYNNSNDLSYDDVKSNLSKLYFKSTKDMANEYLKLYKNYLK